MLHLAAHILLPLCVARLFFAAKWPQAFLVMLCGCLIDLDHLLANPIYDPERCSIGFHPLHSGYAIVGYTALLFLKPLRVLAIGLLLHIALDGIDCFDQKLRNGNSTATSLKVECFQIVNATGRQSAALFSDSLRSRLLDPLAATNIHTS